MKEKQKIGNTIIRNNQPQYNPTYDGLMTVEDAINKYKAFFERLNKLSEIDNKSEIHDKEYSIKRSLKWKICQHLRQIDKSLKISTDYTDFTLLDNNILIFDYYNFITNKREKRSLNLNDYAYGKKEIEFDSIAYYAFKLKEIYELIAYVDHLNEIKKQDPEYAPSKYNKLLRIFPIQLIEGDYISVDIDVKGDIHFKLIQVNENSDNIIIPLENLKPKDCKKIFSMAIDKSSLPDYLNNKEVFEHFYSFNDDFEYISDEYYEFIDLEKELLNLKPKSATIRPEWLDQLKEQYNLFDPSITSLKTKKVDLKAEIEEKEKLLNQFKNDKEVILEVKELEKIDEDKDNLNITGCVLTSGAAILGSGIASFALHTPFYLIPGGATVAGSIITLRTINKIAKNIRRKKNPKIYFNERKQEDLQKEIISLKETYIKCLQTIQDTQKSKELIQNIIEKFDIDDTKQNYEEIKFFEINDNEKFVKSF
jgi:hypothetical protein